METTCKCHYPAMKPKVSKYGGKKKDQKSLINFDKGHPITDHEDPEGAQMYSSTLPSTSALYGGGWPMPNPGPLYPGKDPVTIVNLDKINLTYSLHGAESFLRS